MGKTIKNVFSSFVAFVTIASSVSFGSLGFANVASAAAMSGDLIKASGPTVYYYAADGKRYVFPNEKTYFSWYADFSSVKTISDSELAAIEMKANVTVRPGTKLVKITTDPKTYAVTKGGVLHWVESEAIAKALYGDAWSSRVVDVPDGFFVNYTVGSSVATSVHPDGQLVQYTGDSNYYLVMGGQKRKLAANALSANGLNAANAVMTTISYPNGTDITARESDLADTVVTSGVIVTPQGGALSVTLASDTPAGMTVPKNSSSVKLVKVTLTAGTGAVTVNGLTIHRVGVGAAGDFSNVYLYDANGKRLTTGRTINSSVHTATFSSLNISIAPGAAISLFVYGDFSTPTNTGGQHAIEIADAASVVVGSGSTVSGSFPVRGNVFTVGTSSAGRLDVVKGSTPSNPTVGSTDVEISNFKLVANTNDIDVNTVTLYQAGTVTNSDITKLRLLQGATEVATADAISADGHIFFKFATPYRIGNGLTKVFSVHAAVGGRSGRTIKTYVEYTTDVNGTDVVYTAGPQVCINNTDTGCTSSSASFDGTGTNFITLITQGGNLTNAYNGPPTTNIAKGQLAVPLYKFALTSADQTLEIRNIRFYIEKTNGSGCFVVGSAGTKYFRMIRVIDQDTGKTVMGPAEITATTTSQTVSNVMVLNDAFSLAAGKTMNLAIVSDLSNSEDGTNEFYSSGACGYKVTLNAFQSSDVRITDTGEFLATTSIIPNGGNTGNQMTVKSSSLTVALASSPASGTLVKKAQNAPLAGIVLSAGAQSNVLVTSINLTCQVSLNGTYAAGNCDDRVNSLSLWNGATQVGLAKAPDTSGVAQISNMNLTIPAGTSVTLTVAGTLASTASTTSPYDKVAVGILLAADITAQDKDSNSISASGVGVGNAVTTNGNSTPLVAQTILSSGSITIAADSNPASTLVVAGKDVWVPFAQYKATAQYESMTIDRIAVLASSTAGNTADNADFAMVAIASNGAVKGSEILSSGATGTKDIDLSTNTITVPKDGSVDFQLWAKLSGIVSSSSASGATTGVHRSGARPALGLMGGLTSGEWDTNYAQKVNVRTTGLASGERVYAATSTSHGNIMVTRKSIPTVTKQSLSSTTLANIDQDVMKFQVSADSEGSIALKQVAFSFSKSGVNLVLSNMRLRKGSDEMNTSDYSVTCAGCGAAGINTDLQTGNIAAATTSGFIIVSFKAGSEESIVGSGNVYTLHGSFSGAASGYNFSMSFYKDTSAPIVTGYLTNDVTGAATWPTSANIYHIDTTAGGNSGGTFDATGTFVWADNSEVPHSAALGAGGAGGSYDWTNDVYVKDLSQSQTLSL